MHLNNKSDLFLKPILYDGGFIKNYNKYLISVVNDINNKNIKPETHIIHKEYRLPFNNQFSEEKHYLLLYNIAKLFKVKFMWRLVLDRESLEAIKAIWIIGTPQRIFLCKGFLDRFFNLYYDYYSWICNNKREESKRQSYKNVRSYASKLVHLLEVTTYSVIKKKLVTDRKYEVWLEDNIKVRFKLDYKNYPTDKPEYYHAISNYFYHKRMIL